VYQDEDDRLYEWVAGLTPEIKAAQLLMVAPDPTDDPASVVEWLYENQYGGLFLQWRHLGDREWLLELGERLREMTDEAPPPFLGTDEEGGLVTDLAGITTTAPSPAALGVIDDVQLTYATALAMGEKLKALGFNLVFTPSLDVNSEVKNPVIGTRSFGDTPEKVMKHGMATIEGLARSGIVACIKHFPGHGATRLDSHVTLPEVDASADLLHRRDLMPFRAAIEAGIPMIMTAHVSYPALDPTGGPATLSPEILTEILRNDLGFEGVIVSDGMEMEGIASLGDPGSVAIQAIEAGVDLLMYPLDRDMAAEVAERLARALTTGELAEDRVNEALLRIGRLRLAIVAGEEALDDSTREEILEYQHESLLKQVSAAGITLVNGTSPDIPLRWEDRRGLWVLPTGTEPRLAVDTDHLRDLIEPLNLKLMPVGLKPTDAEREAVLRQLAGMDYAIACTLSRGGLNTDQRRLVDALVATGKRTIVVALNDPHDVDDFPSVKTRLSTYGFGPLVLEGLVDILLGKRIAGEGIGLEDD
jgi:beta-N-acetylhexosaminidase